MQYNANGYPIYGNYPQPYPASTQMLAQPQMQMTQQQTQMQQQNNCGLIWVQGEAGAKSFFVANGCSALLMDSEAQRFFIKSVDESGMPKPLRVFEYAERLPSEPSIPKMGADTTQEKVEYATKEELQEQIQALQTKIDKMTERFSNRKDERNNGKPSV